MMDNCQIGLTLGDLASIGPEIVAKALARGEWANNIQLNVYAHQELLEPFRQKFKDINIRFDASGEIPHFVVGKPNRQTALYALNSVHRSIRDCLKGKIQALVTGPVHKKSIRQINHEFIGHTELLAHECSVPSTTMFMMGKRLRVATVTTHHPLRDVPHLIKKEKILLTIEHVVKALQRLGIENPRIAVSSLNPHGEIETEMDLEEINEIVPAVESAKMIFPNNIDGPISADNVFRQALAGGYDAVVAMYHDQALGPFKTLEFDEGVNMTLGLPFIRTSPDHGTAYDIAGKDIANEKSMTRSIELAIQWVGSTQLKV